MRSVETKSYDKTSLHLQGFTVNQLQILSFLILIKELHI